MVGRGVTEENEALRGWIEATNIPERFLLLGERDDVAELYGEFDLFCLHSKSEGFPNVLAEAMCAKLPCVATDVGDASILLGDAGLIVPSEDYTALAHAIEKLLCKPDDERRELGERACSRIEANWSIESVRRSYWDLYMEVLKR